MPNGEDTLVLQETDRAKLDGIVNQMIANKESDENIQFVVGDFKTKYGKKKETTATTTTAPLQNGTQDLSKDTPTTSTPPTDQQKLQSLPIVGDSFSNQNLQSVTPQQNWQPNQKDLRADGTQKGTGYLGVLKRPDGGVSSEISIGVEMDGKETEIPTLVPTLSKDEIKYLLDIDVSNPIWIKSPMGQSIQKKAVDFAKQRIAQGKNPFADNSESPQQTVTPQNNVADIPVMSEEDKVNALKGINQNTVTPEQQKVTDYNLHNLDVLAKNKVTQPQNQLVKQLDANDSYVQGAKRLQDNPNDTKALFMVGSGFRDVGQDESAKKIFGQILSINPNDEKAKQALFDLSPESGHDAYKQGYDIQQQGGIGSDVKAAQFYQQALQINPNNYKAKVALGNLSAKNNDYSNAINLYTSALQTMPEKITLSDGKEYNNPDFKEALGQIALNQSWLSTTKTGEEKTNLLNSANTITDGLLKDNPDDILANQNKAYIEKQNGNDKEAKDYLTKAVESEVASQPAPTLYDSANDWINKGKNDPTYQMLEHPFKKFADEWGAAHEDVTNQLSGQIEQLGASSMFSHEVAKFLTGAVDVPNYVIGNVQAIGSGLERMSEGMQQMKDSFATKENPNGDTYNGLVGLLKTLSGGATVAFSTAMMTPEGFGFTQGINGADVLTNGAASEIAMSPLKSLAPKSDNALWNEAQDGLDTVWSLLLFHKLHGIKGDIKTANIQNAADKLLSGKSLTGAETKLLTEFTKQEATPENLVKIYDTIKSLPPDTPKDKILPMAKDLLSIKHETLMQMPEELTAMQKIKIAPLLEQRETQAKTLDAIGEPFKPKVKENIKKLDEKINAIVEEAPKTKSFETDATNKSEPIELTPTNTENVSENGTAPIAPKTEGASSNSKDAPLVSKNDGGNSVGGEVLLKDIDKKDENYDSIEEAVKGKNFIKQTVSIDELVLKDKDLQEYLSDNKATKGRKVEKAIIVGDIARGAETQKGGVIDGFHRIAQAIANGETKIDAFVEQPKGNESLSDSGVEYKGIFNNKKTGTGVDKLLNDDGYNFWYKNKKAKVEYMSPDEYLKEIRVGDIHNKGVKYGIWDDPNITEAKKNAIKKAIKEGNKINMPFLDYSNGHFNQEGRNRAAVAKEMGENKIPVMVIEDVTPKELEAKTKELVDEAINKVGNDKNKIEDYLEQKGIHRDGIQTIKNSDYFKDATTNKNPQLYRKNKRSELGDAIYTTTNPKMAQNYSTGEGTLKLNKKTHEGEVVKLSIPKDSKIFPIDDTINEKLFSELSKDKKFSDTWNNTFSSDIEHSNTNIWDAAQEAKINLQDKLQADGYVGARHKTYINKEGENHFDYGIWDENILKQGHDDNSINIYRGVKSETKPQSESGIKSETKTSLSDSGVETKKSDIEKNRQEELNKIENNILEVENSTNGIYSEEGKVAYRKSFDNDIKKINDKYDAELDALKPTPTADKNKAEVVGENYVVINGGVYDASKVKNKKYKVTDKEYIISNGEVIKSEGTFIDDAQAKKAIELKERVDSEKLKEPKSIANAVFKKDGLNADEVVKKLGKSFNKEFNYGDGFEIFKKGVREKLESIEGLNDVVTDADIYADYYNHFLSQAKNTPIKHILNSKFSEIADKPKSAEVVENKEAPKKSDAVEEKPIEEKGMVKVGGKLIDGDKLNFIQHLIDTGGELNSKDLAEKKMFEDLGWKFTEPKKIQKIEGKTERNINSWTNEQILSDKDVRNAISGESMSTDSNGKKYVGVNVLHDKSGDVKFVGNFQEAPQEIQDKYQSGEYQNSIYKITLDKNFNADNVEWIQDNKGERKQIAPKGKTDKSNNAVRTAGGVEREKPINVTPVVGEVNKEFQSKPKLEGEETTIEMPDGESRTAKYMVVSADDIIASHNENSFADSEGYPKENGTNVNPRNYKDDDVAKNDVIDNARNLKPAIVISDSATPDSGVPIISKDGIVLSGNGRTMSIKRAISEFRDKYEVYKNILSKRAHKFGLDANEISKIKNPILVKVDEGVKNYSIKELDKYNQSAQKGESPTDSLLKKSAIINADPDLKSRVFDVIGRHDTMSEFYANPADVKAMKELLLANKVVLDHELSKYFTGNEITPEGKDLISDMLVASVLKPETIKATDIAGVKSFRRNIVNAIPVLSKNFQMDSYSLEREVNDAVKLQAGFKQSEFGGDDANFWHYMNAQSLFELPDPSVVAVNRMIASGEKNFKKIIQKYNTATEGNKGMFAEQALSKEQIISEINKLNLNENEKKNLEKISNAFADAQQDRPRAVDKPLQQEAPRPKAESPKGQIKFERNDDKIKKIDDELDDLLGSFGKKALSGLDPEQSAKAVKVVSLLMQKGYYKFEDMLKWATEKGMNELIPYLKSAYQTVRDTFNLDNELKYSLDNDAEINKAKVVKNKYAPRPPMRMADEGKLPQPKEHIIEGDYNNEINATQRLGANMAIDRFDGGGKGFLLADGAGFGKTRQELAIANEMQERTGKKSLIITENQAIIDGSMRNQARVMGLSLSNFEVGTYNELTDGKIGKGDYGVVIYDEAHNLKNPLAQRSIAQSKVKSEHNVFATATPMDKIEHGLYFLSEITDKSPKEIQKELGVDIEYIKGKDGEVFVKASTSMSAKHYYDKLLQLRNEAIEKGAMVRREYPFYGDFENNTVKMTPEQLAEKNKIETVHNARMEAADNIAIGKLVNQKLNPKSIGGDFGKFKSDLANELAFKNLFAKIKADYEAGKGQYYSEAKDAVRKFEKDERFAMLQNLDKLNESAKTEHIYQQVKKDLADGKQSVVVGSYVGEHKIKAGTEKSKYGYYEKTIKAEDALLNAIAKRLDKEGIPYAKIMGGNKKGGYTIEQDKFQNGDVKVMLMTAKSGGTGIDLDDIKGDAPRVMHIATSEYSGNKAEQLFGRVSRMNTKSPALIKSYYYDENYADQNRKAKSEEKQTTIKNIVSGKEDLDARLKENAEEIAGAEKSKGKNAIVESRGSDIIVKGDTFAIKDKIKELGARWDGNEKAWKLPKEKEAQLDKLLEENNIGKNGDVKEVVQEIAPEPKTVTPEGSKISEGAKKMADKIRGLKTKEITFKDKDGNEIPITKKGVAWNDIVEGVAKKVEETGDILQAIHDYLNEQDWYKGLSKEDKKAVESQLKDGFREDGIVTGITHAETDAAAVRLGLPEFEKNPETFAQWDAEAQARIDNGEIQDVMNKLREDGHFGNPVEQRMVAMYAADLLAKIEKNPTQELINKYAELKKLSDLARSMAGKILVSGKGLQPVIENIADMYVAKMEATGVNKLTEKQIADVQRLHDKYKKSEEVANAKIAELEEKYAKLKAEKELGKIKKESKPTGKKTHDEYVSERKDLIKQFKEAGKSKPDAPKQSGAPITDEQVKIVLKIAKSFLDEGLDNLGIIVDNISDSLGIDKKVIHDAIAGNYTVKKTRGELAAKMRDLSDEAKYINKYEALLRGELPKTEKAKIERNQKIKELQDKIKDFKKEQSDAEKLAKEDAKIKKAPELSALERIKKQNENKTKEIREKIAKGDFAKEEKLSVLENPEVEKNFPKEHKEALDAITAREDASHEWDIAVVQDQMNRRGTVKKIVDFGGDVLGTTKSIVTGIDDSAVFVQNLYALISHPKSAPKALVGHLTDFWSEKNFTRWLTQLHNSSSWGLIEKSGLNVTEPKSLSAKNKEEVFNRNLLNKEIKIKGKSYVVGKYLTQPFERMFTSLGNRLRVDIFLRGAQELYDKGITFENSPKEFTDLANILNTETGRGKLPEVVERFSPVITPIIWSPKLMQSTINILGISDIGMAFRGKKGYYGNLTPTMRKYAAKSFGKFMTAGAVAMLYFAWQGWEPDLDPRSVKFGTVTKNGKSINIFGRFSPYIRLVAQELSGTEKKNGIVTKLDKHGRAGKIGRFFWGKLTPIAGSVANVGMGETYMGDPVTVGGEATKLLTPISIQSMANAARNEGYMSIINSDIPAFIGVPISYQNDFKIEMPKSIKFGDSQVDLNEQQQKEYQDWYDLKSEAYLNGLVNTDQYKNVDDETKQKLRNMVINAAKSEAKNQIQKEYSEQFTETYDQVTERFQQDLDSWELKTSIGIDAGSKPIRKNYKAHKN